MSILGCANCGKPIPRHNHIFDIFCSDRCEKEYREDEK